MIHNNYDTYSKQNAYCFLSFMSMKVTMLISIRNWYLLYPISLRSNVCTLINTTFRTKPQKNNEVCPVCVIT